MPTTRQTEKVHTIPRPRPPIDPRTDPFVGNATTDDNLAEACEVAIWNTMGDAGRCIDIEVANGVVTLSGELQTMRHCRAVERAVANVRGVREIASRLAADPKHAESDFTGEPHLWQTERQQLISLTRYCGTDEASLSAAIRDAVARLDAWFTAQKLELPKTLFVLYRNRQHDSMTLEIGMPYESSPKVAGEFHVGTSPAGLTMSIQVAPGAADLMHGCTALCGHARAAGYEPAAACWQQFDASVFRPWAGHPAHTLNVAVTRAA